MTAVLLMLAAILPTAAAPPIDTAAACSLTIQTEYAGSPLSGMRFSLYRVATTAESGYYTLTADYAASGTDVNGVTDAGGWRAAAESLAAWTAKHSVAALAQATSDAQGETTEPTGTTASGETGTTAPDETTIPGEVTGTTEPEETTTPGGSTEPGETTEPGTTTEPGGDLPQTGQLKWPVPVMFALGVLLSIIGILLRRRDDDA